MLKNDSIPFKCNSFSFQITAKELNDNLLIIIKLCQANNDIFSQPLLMGKTEIEFNQFHSTSQVIINESFALLMGLSINGREIVNPIVKFMGRSFGSECLVCVLPKSILNGFLEFELYLNIDYTQAFLLKNIATQCNVLDHVEAFSKYDIEGLTSFLTSTTKYSSTAVKLIIANGTYCINFSSSEQI